jgi:hypothetical protein
LAECSIFFKAKPGSTEGDYHALKDALGTAIHTFQSSYEDWISKKGHVFTVFYSGGDVLCLNSGAADSNMNLVLSSLADGHSHIPLPPV